MGLQVNCFPNLTDPADKEGKRSPHKGVLPPLT